MKKDIELAKEVIRISGANPTRCMKCGKCSASCPSFNEMEYAPHKFVDMIVHNRVQELLDSKSIFYCLSCFACVERCPRGVEPAKIVEAIRVVKQREVGENYLDANEIPQIVDEQIPQQALVSAFRKFKK